MENTINFGIDLGTTNSAIAKFIEKKGEGIHHIAYEVDNIYDEMERLKNEGFEVLNKEPKAGADNKKSQPVQVEMWYYKNIVKYDPKRTYKETEITMVNDKAMNIAFFNNR